MEQILKISKNVQRTDIGDKNIMIVDHCFDIKNKGTVLTGTMISGTFVEGDLI